MPPQTVRSTLDAMNAACAARDLAAFMALFDDDPVLFVGSDKPEVFRGRAATEGFIRMFFGAPFTAQFDLSDVVIRENGDSAWAFVNGEMVRTGDRGAAAGKVGRNAYRITVTMVRKDGRWRWQHFHGSVPGAE